MNVLSSLSRFLKQTDVPHAKPRAATPGVANRHRQQVVVTDRLEDRVLLSVARFSWSMPDRFGIDQNGDGRIDVHNDGAQQTSGYTVNFDASRSSGRNLTYAWEISGGDLATPLDYTSSQPTAVAHLDLGTYQVKLKASEPGKGTSVVVGTVQVRDILWVSIGDSYASGEGDPEVPRTPGRNAVWGDSPAADARHFSILAAPAQAALAMERSDPHSSVTFVSVACSGSLAAAQMLTLDRQATPAAKTQYMLKWYNHYQPGVIYRVTRDMERGAYGGNGNSKYFPYVERLADYPGKVIWSEEVAGDEKFKGGPPNFWKSEKYNYCPSLDQDGMHVMDDERWYLVEYQAAIPKPPR